MFTGESTLLANQPVVVQKVPWLPWAEAEAGTKSTCLASWLPISLMNTSSK